MSLRLRKASLLLGGVLLLLGCASAGAGGPAPSAPPGGAVITAADLAFDRAELALPADRPFPLLFENREVPPHNVTFYAAGSPPRVLFTGEVITGPGSITYEIPALPPGTYRFRCDVHPEMVGTAVAR